MVLHTDGVADSHPAGRCVDAEAPRAVTPDSAFRLLTLAYYDVALAYDAVKPGGFKNVTHAVATNLVAELTKLREDLPCDDEAERAFRGLVLKLREAVLSVDRAVAIVGAGRA
ncbi:hypothetical protein OPKNFCMD_3862 [Methylobacterium crusticola]|uniref:Uncharacterized protein n=1 Tax=Methylobacterium crusticola TaxID=1697972 RepID=A0ABQ4R2Q9_9HYPH|nr:hypothetical protein [Methylobacterium crusticola]GJD51111.1 hypothetical protein OPKNFCMD_3862 [Methylobacterium crusticola]